MDGRSRHIGHHRPRPQSAPWRGFAFAAQWPATPAGLTAQEVRARAICRPDPAPDRGPPNIPLPFT